VNVLGSNQWSEDVVPTVAFNLRQVRKGNVTMKVWDVAVSLSIYDRSTRRRGMGGVELIDRGSQSLEGCGIGIAEVRTL
jgi:hypothetical protein